MPAISANQLSNTLHPQVTPSNIKTTALNNFSLYIRSSIFTHLLHLYRSRSWRHCRQRQLSVALASGERRVERPARGTSTRARGWHGRRPAARWHGRSALLPSHHCHRSLAADACHCCSRNNCSIPIPIPIRFQFQFRVRIRPPR